MQEYVSGVYRRILLLDGFSINEWMPSASPASPLRAVVYLALHGPTPRQQLAGALWPEASQERALGSLRSGIWRLRRDFPGLLDVGPGVLRLHDHVTTDVEELSGVARAVLDREGYLPPDLGVLLRGGELVPLWLDDWIATERDRLRQLRLDALDAVADTLIGAGRTGLALQAGLAALATDPLRESSCRQVIRAYLLQGNLAQARKQYEDYAARLAHELGVDPSPFTRRLFALDARGLVLNRWFGPGAGPAVDPVGRPVGGPADRRGAGGRSARLHRAAQPLGHLPQATGGADVRRLR